MSLFSDLASVAKEINDIKKDVTSAFSGLTDEVDIIRQETISTVNEIKDGAISPVADVPIDNIKTTSQNTNKPD